MGVECTIYTGPVVILTPPRASSSYETMACEKCGRRQMQEGAFCSRDGAKYVNKLVERVLRPGEWAAELEEEREIIDVFNHVSREAGIEIPDDQVWLTLNLGKTPYCKYMYDPCRGGWSHKKNQFELFWVRGDDVLMDPQSMLNEFLADERYHKAIEVYREAGAKVVFAVATLAWCS